MFQHKLNGHSTPEVNLIPLIDVSLTLVVILLLAAPLAFESSIGVRKGADAGRSAPQNTADARTELRVVSENVVTVNRQQVDRAELSGALRNLLDAGGSRHIVVACAEEVSHGAFVDVLDQTKAAGATDIAVAGK